MHHGFFVLLLIAISTPLCAIASAEYLRHYRVFTAQKMLLEEQQITQVAYSCGLKSPNYFSTCFKRVFGVSPSEFINQQLD